ncbi:CapA family protein [Clostridia bacterium]|nr:CapA family protein [Clostridia bacterium]
MNRPIKLFLLISMVVILATSNNVSTKGQVTLKAVGDILLDRGVRRDMDRDYDYPYQNVLKELANADIVIGNLECPLTEEGNPVLKEPSIVFRGDPRNAEALKKAGFQVLSLANNHTMDYDEQGFLNTISNLQKQGINSIGAVFSGDTFQKPVFIAKNGCTIGFLAYSVFPPEGYVSLKGKADVARYNKVGSIEEIRRVKKECDLLVVSFHWGKEFSYYPSEQQKEIGHQVVEAGADLVLGHHPHVVQSNENYLNGYIFYSLGNFIFDRQIPSGTDESVIVEIIIRNKKIVEMNSIPLKIKNSQPFKDEV